ncbi:Cytochrome P450 [Frankia canadensis]|uniref:Cytochrome P450 n=1 Tax=Frankia canadensis TaxID=1836972 RepID=A0A2I2KM82_9ACTN|nr:cytochrome P450 [Frankia canadensis]SNQ46775.1 Cytochrome P450 [Frankia canadensis]SOU54065.1 Cytochrome P450 [Frankia canadensis]
MPAVVETTGTSASGFTGIMSALMASRLPDPYPVLRSVREAGSFLSGEIAGSPVTLVTTHAEASAVLAHPAIGHGFRDGISYRGHLDDGLGSLVRADPPDHGRLRRLVGRAFTPGVVDALGPRITELCDALLDEALAAGEVDMVEALTRPMPLRVMCRLLGVPAEDEPEFGGWVDALTRGIDPRPSLTPAEVSARASATVAFDDYFRDLIARRRAEPRDDLLSALVAIHDDGDVLSERELLELCTLLLVAGYETTVNLLGGGILALIRNPDQLALLREDPALVGPAVEEMLRHDPPIQLIARTVLADARIAGHDFRQGEGVILHVGTANRDPAAFDEPDRFLVTRYAGGARVRRHLGFGVGIHYCLGAPLARAEAEIAFRTLLRRVRTLTLLDDDVAYRERIVIRGVRSLPLRLTA